MRHLITIFLLFRFLNIYSQIENDSLVDEMNRAIDSLTRKIENNEIKDSLWKKYYDLGVLYHWTFKYNPSIMYLSKSIEINPDFLDSYSILGLSYLYNNDLTNACLFWEKGYGKGDSTCYQELLTNCPKFRKEISPSMKLTPGNGL